VKFLGADQVMESEQDGGDLGSARELIAVIGDGPPERDDVAVGDDWLIDVNSADCRIIGGFQPTGDGDGATGVGRVGMGREIRAMTGVLR
jgi:hypothetical protein